MNVIFHPVSSNPDLQEAQAENRKTLSNGVLQPDGSAVKCLYNGPHLEYAPRLDEEQLVCMASIDNWLMKFGGTLYMGDVEVYANGAINVFIKGRDTGRILNIATIRPNPGEAEYYDRLAEEHGQA